ncbi:MAG: AzlC family ABC transporter permease [Firmicutes bacterium]|nr:AzlC family ABC transporter permease [Bacillota bacterium]
MGMKSGLPIAFGYLPIAVAFGLLAKANGLSAVTSVLMSALVFAGASQFIAVNLLATGIGCGEIIITTFLVNMRHFLMSATLTRHLGPQPPKTKALVAFGITDETFSLVVMQPEHNRFPGFVAGVNTAAYLGWVLGTAVGAVLVNGLPAILQSSMGLALYAMFIGLLIPGLKGSKANLAIFGLTLALSVVAYWGPSWLTAIGKGWKIMIITVVACSLGALLFPEEEKKDAR